MRRFVAIAAASCAAALLAAACRPTPVDVVVTHAGVLHEVMTQGATGAAARVAPGDDVYGLGALAGLAGEVTVVDGVVWTSRPGPDGAPVTTSGDTVDACLYVDARVPRWTRVPVAQEIRGAALDEGVRRLAADAGVDTTRPFPFLIEGRVRALAWHVIDGARVEPGAAGHDAHLAASQRGVLDDVDATIVGFHSTAHRGVFTHHDRDTHMHVVAPGLSAHVDDVLVPRGAVLALPGR